MLSPHRKRQLGLFGLVSLFLSLLWLIQMNSPSAASTHFQPDQQATTRSRTPTPTRTPTSTPDPARAETEDEPATNGGPNPFFVGFGFSVEYQLVLPELCAGAVIPEDGQAWVVSPLQINITTEGATLYIQRCVGSLNVLELLPLQPENFELVLPTELQPVRPTLLLPLATMPVLMAQPQATPIPTRFRPILEPVFPVEPILPIIPTLEAPDRFDDLGPASITLRTPGGELIQLENSGRPDLWTYYFPVSAEAGEYAVIIRDGDEQVERTVNVTGDPRVFFVRPSSGSVGNRAPNASDVSVSFADFEPDRQVTARLYVISEGDPSTLAFSTQPVALTEIGQWNFSPGPRWSRPLSELLQSLGGPPIGNFIVLACYSDECNNLPLITPFGVRWPTYVFTSVFIEPTASALAFPAQLQEIRFARGATAADVDLNLADRGVDGYTLGIAAGQHLMLSADTPNLYAYLMDPNGNLLLPELFSAGEIVIPQNGVYTLIVYGQVNARMHVEIPAP